jgi:hypothetical protein
MSNKKSKSGQTDRRYEGDALPNRVYLLRNWGEGRRAGDEERENPGVWVQEKKVIERSSAVKEKGDGDEHWETGESAEATNRTSVPSGRSRPSIRPPIISHVSCRACRAVLAQHPLGRARRSTLVTRRRSLATHSQAGDPCILACIPVYFLPPFIADSSIDPASSNCASQERTNNFSPSQPNADAQAGAISFTPHHKQPRLG